MDNAILKSVSVENFASFADRITFSTMIDYSKKEHLQNTFTSGDLTFNKVSFIYGANGSGKTFFCKIIREIQRFLIRSSLAVMDSSKLFSLPHLKEINAPVSTFAFDISYKEKPTKFSIDIIISKTNYHYEFAIQGKDIIFELLTKKYRRTEKLIERSSPSFNDINLRSELKDFEDMKKLVKSDSLCLPVASLFNNELAKIIESAINQIQVVNMAAARLQPIKPEKSFCEERLHKYINILQKADPTLRDMNVYFKEEEIEQPERDRNIIESDDFENREIIAKKTSVGVETKHAVYNGIEETSSTDIPFFADESLGTVKIFTALPYLYDVLERGGTLIIDELENGLHLSLAKEIIKLFISEESNPNHAQLICTSHQPLLVEGDIRRDQVWVMYKNCYGKSFLHRISELKTSRAKTNLANKLLEGAFGCNPEPFFDNNT